MSSRESCKNPLDLLATSKFWTMYAKHIWMKISNVVRVINDIHRARLRHGVRVWEDILSRFGQNPITGGEEHGNALNAHTNIMKTTTTL